MTTRKTPPPEPPTNQSDRAAQLERQAAIASEESRRKAEEARQRIDEKLANFLADEDLEDTTGVHNLRVMVEQTPPVPPDVEAVAAVMTKQDEPPVTPKQPAADSPVPTTVRPAEPLKPSMWRVVVADDDRELVDAVCELLRGEGYDCRKAYDGVEALDKVLRVHPLPDCLILDLGMPYLSGEGVQAAILTRKDLEGFPILFVSGAEPEALPKHARKEWVFIKKPLNPKRVEEMLATLAQRIPEWRERRRMLPF
jgi:CheY-like chemotaxis protein